MKKATFDISIRCHYPNGGQTEHRQPLKLADIPKWIEAYKFTHPQCSSVSIKIWFSDLNKKEVQYANSI